MGISEDAIKGIEEGNKEQRTALEMLGIDYKAVMAADDNDEDDKPGAPKGAKKKPDNDADDAKAKEAGMAAFKSMIDTSMKEYFGSSEAKEMFKSLLDEAASEMMGPRTVVAVNGRPSQNDANVAADGRTKAAKEAAGDVSWFEKMMGEVMTGVGN